MGMHIDGQATTVPSVHQAKEVQNDGAHNHALYAGKDNTRRRLQPYVEHPYAMDQDKKFIPQVPGPVAQHLRLEGGPHFIDPTKAVSARLRALETQHMKSHTQEDVRATEAHRQISAFLTSTVDDRVARLQNEYARFEAQRLALDTQITRAQAWARSLPSQTLVLPIAETSALLQSTAKPLAAPQSGESVTDAATGTGYAPSLSHTS